MVVDGVELLRLIRDGEIANGDRIQFGGEIFVFNIEEREFYVKGKPEQNQYSLFQCWTIDNIFDFKFEILSEEDKEIDIQAIEEYKTTYTERCIDKEVRDKINEIIKSIKQLDKKIK